MVTANASTNINDEKETVQKDTVVFCFRLLFQNLHGGTKNNHPKLNPVYTLVSHDLKIHCDIILLLTPKADFSRPDPSAYDEAVNNKHDITSYTVKRVGFS